VLGFAEHGLREAAGTRSFVHLGGTSLRAAALAAAARRDLRRHVEVADLLADRPLRDVLGGGAEIPAADEPVEEARGGPGPRVLLPVSAGQTSMLLADEVGVGTAFHLLFSAELCGQLEESRLHRAIAATVARHCGLRTVFVPGPGGIRARVVAQAEPVILREDLPGLGEAAVAAIQETVAARSHQLLRPYERPPVVFVLSHLTNERSVLSLLVHHAIADGWSIGLVLREIFASYGDPSAGGGHDVVGPLLLDEGSPAVAELADMRAKELAAFPHRLRLVPPLYPMAEFDRRGARLASTLTDAERAACEELARTCGVTRNAALFAAWTLTLARICGATEFLVGLSVLGRTASAEMAAVGMATKLLPVTCTVPAGERCRDFVRATADRMRRAFAVAAVPMEHLVHRLGLGGEVECNPLIQAGFSAHDDLVPARFTAGGLDVSIVEGHCGGTVFDAMLYVQRWGAAPRLVVEYASSTVGPQAADLLMQGVRQSLVGMAASPDAAVRDVPVVTDAQERRLSVLGAGPAVDTGVSAWQLVEASARRTPGAPAVRGASGEVSYAELVRAAERWSASLAAVGVGPGDCVAVVVARSVSEVAGLLGIIRLGAHYLSIGEGTPDPVVAHQLAIARPKAVIAEPRRASYACRIAGERPVVVITEPAGGEPDGEPDGRGPACPPAAAHDPARPIYIAFTSGTTGRSKGVRVPDRAVVRLVRDAGFLRDGATDRFLRLAPLAFDASTLELFAPLAAGGCIQVYPDRPVDAAELGRYIVDHGVTGLWLTSGLFRLMADHHPECFRGVGQLLTGGDVVPPDRVATVLDTCPGLRISNGYGPTENTTFSTVHHVDDSTEVESPLPIGRPIQGGSVVVVDHLGGLAAPGAVGELYVAGDGLALDYAENPTETADRFVYRADGRRYYRTGDLVCWDARGRLRFYGRQDNQVKIHGYRVELDHIDHVLRRHPAVSDVLVTTFTAGDQERRILAVAIAPADDGGLVARLREHAERELARYAVPSRWLVLDRIPLTPNGKPDVTSLIELSAALPAPAPASAEAAQPPPEDVADFEDAIAQAWEAVLGTDDFGYAERFFDVGGSSIQLPALRAEVRTRLPDHPVSVMDLLRHPTVATLARHLSARRGEPS
jgi:amino acid adenylation domain-containing protein